HPPMVAVVIRLGTMIAGDTAFGVRLVAILLGLPMSWAVWRAAGILFRDARLAATATILLNATLMVAAGTVIMTPDAPLMVASSFVLLCLAKVLETGRGVWWLGVGAAVGCGLLSKYTAFFFGAEILLWLLLVKDQRRWLASPWPYLGGILAFAIFAPVILWNADHQWVSFIKQLGRARIEGFTLKYLGEMIPAQFAFATPSVFILGALGLYALRRGSERAARVLINVSFWVIAAYFVWHAFHERVEANWLGPVYPAFAIAAAYAVHAKDWAPRTQRLVDLSRRWALPIGIALFAALIVQTNTGLFTGFRRDPSVRAVAVGWSELAREIDALRRQQGAACVLARDYGTTSLLMFYLPGGSCVAQRGERYRWIDTPEPADALLRGKVLLIGPAGADNMFRADDARSEKLADLARRRSGVAVETYEAILLEGPRGETLDRVLPPELGGPRR
ncbi:MAG: glycosyltransferase family 39 protein, partial [Variibacter sp.]|nr:glycosyltransferase family 39 protein [Variibacter sp.]